VDVRAGVELLNLARAAGARSIFVVGTGRGVGKTTVVRALYSAASTAGLRAALASLNPKHRFWLQSDTPFVTARGVLARTPAAAILNVTGLQSPAGALLYARAESSGLYELAGPPTASGVREVVDELQSLSDIVIVDGAVDRIAALAGSDGAIVVACGAAAAKTMHEAVDEIGALVARLRVPRFEESEPAIELDGALTASHAAAFLSAREQRQIVVRDPTQIALGGKAAIRALSLLEVRCRRPLRVIAATVASIGPELSFEPREFGAAVHASTGLPAYDLYSGTRAA
jgi:Domain of unknown function (DUF1611_C) P-loop domain